MVIRSTKVAGNFYEILLFIATSNSQKIVCYGCIESIYDDILSIKQKHYCISIFLYLINMYITISVLCFCSRFDGNCHVPKFSAQFVCI